jgi:4-carboxymuconolactone decarboxylase
MLRTVAADSIPSRVPRLPYYDPDDGPEKTRELLDSTPLSLLRMAAHAQGAFDPLLRELAILQVAHLLDSPYEWVQHDVLARSIGASDAQVAAVEHDREDDASFSVEQRLVLRFSREVILDGAGSEQTTAELAALLGPRQLVELLLLIGQYMSIARLIATTGLEPDAPLPAGMLARPPDP